MSDVNNIPLRYRAAAVFSIFAIGYTIGSSVLPDLVDSVSRAGVEKARLEYDMAAAQRAVAKRFDTAMEAEKRMIQGSAPAAAAAAPSFAPIPASPAPLTFPQPQLAQPSFQPLPQPQAPALQAPLAPIVTPPFALQPSPEAKNEAIAPSSIDRLLEVGRFGSRFGDPSEFGLK